MAYTFEDLFGKPKENEQPKEKIKETIKITEPEDTPKEPVRLEQNAADGNDRPKPVKTVLFGEDIHQTTIPVHTAKGKRRPLVVFENPEGTRFGMDEELLSKHLLCIGGIGSGKTNAIHFLTESLLSGMTRDDIMFIFDTKGDFYEKFYEKNNPNHIVIGNGEEYEEETCYWDLPGEILIPLEEGEERPLYQPKYGKMPDGRRGCYIREGKYDQKRCDVVIKEISKKLFAGKESESQPFFASAAADLVRIVLSWFFREGSPRRLNNKDIVEFFRSADAKAYYEITQSFSDFQGANLYFGDPNAPMTPQALGVFGYINEMINDLFVGIFEEGNYLSKAQEGRSFSMRKLVRERGRKVVFIEYDLKTGETLSPMYSLLMDLALKEALGRRKNKKGNAYFIIDEFKLLPDLKHIEDALNYGRSLGVKVVAGLQSINQLYDIYGEEKGKVIAAGFMNSFCFQTWDYESRKYISDRFGDNYVDLSYRVDSRQVPLQREGHTVEDWDILNLDIGEAFINLVREKPFRFQFSDFEKPHRILAAEKEEW